MTSDPDLEAKMRLSLRSILDDSFLGEEVALWRVVVGSCPGCPEGGGGGGGLEGDGGTQHLSPAWGGDRSQGTPMV